MVVESTAAEEEARVLRDEAVVLLQRLLHLPYRGVQRDLEAKRVICQVSDDERDTVRGKRRVWSFIWSGGGTNVFQDSIIDGERGAFSQGVGPPARGALKRAPGVQEAPHTRAAEGVAAGKAQGLPLLRAEPIVAYLTLGRHVCACVWLRGSSFRFPACWRPSLEVLGVTRVTPCSSPLPCPGTPVAAGGRHSLRGARAGGRGVATPRLPHGAPGGGCPCDQVSTPRRAAPRPGSLRATHSQSVEKRAL